MPVSGLGRGLITSAVRRFLEVSCFRRELPLSVNKYTLPWQKTWRATSRFSDPSGLRAATCGPLCLGAGILLGLDAVPPLSCDPHLLLSELDLKAYKFFSGS
ncbi:hypothetical protein E2C01_096352 [Portunus trituberculatus]|uniref:Uncharacterized protein n=1 Tax=Portunus trituberculatus TaxID=210409 RepID=A0A5B7K6M7_PORTR|nr:hypothetical protein [Portunus trituberculatus]